MAIKNGDLDYYDVYKKQILKRKGVVATPEEYAKGRMSRFYRPKEKPYNVEEDIELLRRRARTRKGTLRDYAQETAENRTR